MGLWESFRDKLNDRLNWDTFVSEAGQGLETMPEVGMAVAPWVKAGRRLYQAGKLSKIPVSKNELFDIAVASAQRGAPESAMLKTQMAYGGGVLNPTIEHVGDLTHRMAEKVTAGTRGYDIVGDKVEKTLRWLTNEYGFKREMLENLLNNAKYHGRDVQDLTNEVTAKLLKYAAEHSKLPVMNNAQYLARDAAMKLGKQDFEGATEALSLLKGYLDKGKSFWKNKASQVNLDMLNESLRK